MERNWEDVNQKYIKQGEFLVNPAFLESWNEEVKSMNAGKVGEPYFYPDSMIEFTAYLHCYFGYRQCEGFLRGISNNHKYKFPVISYTQIYRRLNKLEVDFKCVEENMIIAIDGSGEKVSNRGEWIRQKWKIRRGWIKVVVMGNEKGEIVDIRVGPETLNERKAARGLIRKNHKKISKVIMDGLHDCRKTFNLCDDLGLPVAIKIREGASTKAKNSPKRKEEVIIYQSMPHEEWVREKGYGMRWPASEGIFSAKKRVQGEVVRAVKKRNMYKEIRLRYWAYNNLAKIS
jgi:hypothetical protein